jgi:hypothetical protein
MALLSSWVLELMADICNVHNSSELGIFDPARFLPEHSLVRYPYACIRLGAGRRMCAAYVRHHKRPRRTDRRRFRGCGQRFRHCMGRRPVQACYPKFSVLRGENLIFIFPLHVPNALQIKSHAVWGVAGRNVSTVLFSLYVNDMPTPSRHVELALYADDGSWLRAAVHWFSSGIQKSISIDSSSGCGIGG